MKNVTKEEIIKVLKDCLFIETAADKILKLFQPQPEQWNFIDAVNAVKSGSHQIERDCDNIDLLKAVLMEAFPEDKSDFGMQTDLYNFFNVKRNKENKFWGYYSKYESFPIIPLSQIQPKPLISENNKKFVDSVFGKELKVTMVDMTGVVSQFSDTTNYDVFKNGDEVEYQSDEDYWEKAIFIGLINKECAVIYAHDDTREYAVKGLRKPQSELNTIKQKVRKICKGLSEKAVNEVSEIILKEGKL